jgi:hypothetical protein
MSVFCCPAGLRPRSGDHESRDDKAHSEKAELWSQLVSSELHRMPVRPRLGVHCEAGLLDSHSSAAIIGRDLPE